MSSDRGTIPRGSDARGWSEPTAPSGRRLPSAPRERKPALAALAVVLIVGGALVAALLVIQSGHKTGAIEITQTVGQGQQLSTSAMQEVQVTSGIGVDYVPWDQASQVTRYYAANTIPAGTLLTPAMTVASNDLAAGRTQLGLAVKDGQLPDGLQVGDHIDIYSVSDSSGVCPRPTSFVLTTNAVVLAITHPSSTTSSAVDDVQVGVDPTDAGPVACNAANNNVSIGIIPNDGSSSSTGGTSPSTGGSSPGANASTSPASGGKSSSTSGGT
ncbi:MAG TPA: hypothetical protein VGH27_20670 [Streptosporangiaceae bacterium]|jgi:hypothetical protein